MYNHGLEMGQLNLKLFALVGVIMLVLAGTSFGYLFRLKNKSRASYLLMWFFLCVCGSAVATILTNLGTSWERAFAPAQDALLILGGVFLVRFAYVYPHKDQPQEARLATILYSGLALFCLGYALLFALNYFISLPRQLDENRVFYIITPLAVLLVAGLFFRRFYHWRKQPDLIMDESGFLEEPGAEPPASPVNQQAASALRDLWHCTIAGVDAGGGDRTARCISRTAGCFAQFSLQLRGRIGDIGIDARLSAATPPIPPQFPPGWLESHWRP